MCLLNLTYFGIFSLKLILCDIINSQLNGRETAQFVNLQTLQYEERPLDNLDMILYDAFLKTKIINQAIEEVGPYFPKAKLETDYRKFQDLVLDRIKAGLYLGLLERK
jgi:hypothetical protein